MGFLFFGKKKFDTGNLPPTPDLGMPAYKGIDSQNYSVISPAYDGHLKKKVNILRWIFVFLVCVFFLVVSTVALYLFVIFPNPIKIQDQKVVDGIFVDQVKVSQSAFLAFQLPNKYNKPGVIIATSDYLSPDSYEDFNVDLLPRVLQGTEDAKIESGTVVFAVLYEDVENNGLTPSTDRVLADLFGRKAITSFVLK